MDECRGTNENFVGIVVVVHLLLDFVVVGVGIAPATQLADMNAELLDTYAGDLRKLREAAAGSPKALRKRLKAFKGIGGTGADIFLREIQTAWDECYPYADKAALSAADKLGLKADAAKLADKVSHEDYPKLMAALVRCKLAKDTQGVLEAAKA